MIIKYFPEAAEGVVEKQKIEVARQPTPAELAVEFSTEQLPSLSDIEPDTRTIPDKVVEVKKEGVPTPKANDKANETNETKEDSKTDEKVKEEDDEKAEDTKVEEVAESGVSKYLKPPKGKEGVKTPDKAGTKDSFDYSKYSPQQVTYLKNMSREAREFTANLIKETTELGKLKDSNYLQHPEAYVLDPAYRELTSTVENMSNEARHWQEQLMLCKSGKPVRDIQGYDKNGKLVMGPEIPPSDEVEEKLRMNVSQAHNSINSIQGQLKDYPNKYSSRVKGDMAAIENHRNSIFEWNKNPELLEYSVEMEDGSDKSIKSIRDDYVNMWPQYMRNDPRTKAGGDLMASLVLVKAELRELSKSKSIATTKQSEKERVEPNSTTKPAPKNSQEINGVKEFSSKDMPSGLD